MMLPSNPLTANLPMGAKFVIFIGQWLLAFIMVTVISVGTIRIMGFDWWRTSSIFMKSVIISFPMVLIMSTVNPHWARYIARKWPR